MNETPPPLLSIQGLTKRFGDVVANNDIHLDIHAGRIHALLGENGAGKSTLMSMLAGRYRPDEGRILLRGAPVRFQSPADSLAAGVGMVYQRFMLIKQLTVAENILLALNAKGEGAGPRKAKKLVAELSQRYGLEVAPKKRIHRLTMGERQRVEILKQLSLDSEILILDEPTAVLTPPEIDPLFTILRRLRDEGRAIVFISHKMDEVLSLADELSVLRGGRVAARNLPVGAHTRREELARLMIGEDMCPLPSHIHGRDALAGVAPSDVVLEVSGLARPHPWGGVGFEDVNFSVHKGEIFSIIGVSGNGQGLLARCLAGLTPWSKGALRFQNREYSPKRWLKQRDLTAYVPEDRDATGSVPAMSLVENLLLTRFRTINPGARLDTAKGLDLTKQAIKDFDVKAAGPFCPAGSLSGGNLQKFLMARELGKNTPLLITENPTHGLDVKAAGDVHKALLDVRDRAAVLLFTGDMEEALVLSSRIAVIFQGRILATFDNTSAQDHLEETRLTRQIGLAMAGVQHNGAAHANC